MSLTNIFIIAAGILMIGSLMIACGSIQPARIAYQLPHNQIANQAWDDIMRQPAHIDSFLVLNTGSVKVPRSGMLNQKRLADKHGLPEYLWVDVFVFLFHHETRGWFMIDTGLDSTFQGKGNIKGIYASNFIKESKQTPGQNIAAQLRREAKHINGIFLTHLHGDHTAGLPEIDRSIPIYTAKEEEYHHIPLIYQPNHLSSDDTLIELDWESGTEMAPFESVMDIFGDGSFLAIHTPGHSNHHLSYLLMTDEGTILLTGDASHTKYGFINQIEPGWVEDQDLAKNSLDQLIEFVNRYPEIQVIYGHER